MRMITIDIPGFRVLHILHLVLDYNGTLAADGELLPGVGEALRALAGEVRIHVITADTFGRAAEMLAGLPVDLVIAPATAQDEAKLEFVTALGADRVVAIGNGRNDRRMLEAAALGIAVIQREGASAESLRCADVVATDVLDALDLLRHPRRLIATLRS
jgi:soluble P-type ATPase